MRWFPVLLAAPVVVIGLGFFVLMVMSIITGQGDYKYDAIMAMLSLILAVNITTLVASRRSS